MHPEASFSLGAFLPYPGASMYQMAKREGFEVPTTTEEWVTSIASAIASRRRGPT